MNDTVITPAGPYVPGKAKKALIHTERSLKWVIYAFMLLIAVSLYIPVIWMIINSFKADFEYLLKGTFELPGKMMWSNYSFMFTQLEYKVYTQTQIITFNIYGLFYNSIVFSFFSSVYPPLIVMCCGYAIARYRVPGRNLIFNIGIVIMILPILGTSAATMILYKTLGIYDNMFLLILTSPRTAFSGMSFLLFYGAFSGIPSDYTEAAALDGAGHFRIFLQIVAPLVIPLYGMQVLLAFIGSWNDFSTFLYWIPTRANIALGMYEIQQVSALEGATMPQILAGFTIVAIPTAAMFLVAQPLMSKNFNVGGLKG